MNTSPWLTLLWVLHPHWFSEHPLSFPPILQSYTSLDKAHLGSMYRCRYKVYIIWMRSSTIHRSFYRCLHPSSIGWSRRIKKILLLSSQLLVNHIDGYVGGSGSGLTDTVIVPCCNCWRYIFMCIILHCFETARDYFATSSSGEYFWPASLPSIYVCSSPATATLPNWYNTSNYCRHWLW